MMAKVNVLPALRSSGRLQSPKGDPLQSASREFVANQINLKSVSPVGSLVLSLFLAGILFIVFEGLPHHLFVPCTRLLFQPILLALGSTLAINILLALFWRHPFRLSLLVLSALFLVSLFLGSYRYSPPAYSKGDDSILHGFLITRQGRVNEIVASGDVIVLSAGMPAAISIRSDLRDMSCRWISRNGGTWDDPFSCDTLYVPPSADYDILAVMIEPGCRLPPVRGQIKISILP
jgi:hypothetical protein